MHPRWSWLDGSNARDGAHAILAKSATFIYPILGPRSVGPGQEGKCTDRGPELGLDTTGEGCRADALRITVATSTPNNDPALLGVRAALRGGARGFAGRRSRARNALG
eukprot:2642364-Pyramimonas_sp.AAC.1